MKELTAPIDKAGRVVLPKSVREELAIRPGDTLKISIQGLSVTLTPSKEETGFIRKGRALVFATAGDETLSQATADLLLKESRDERDDRIMGRFREIKRGK
jgi:AbrB family looped-hinge helix DNA binding protein